MADIDSVPRSEKFLTNITERISLSQIRIYSDANELYNALEMLHITEKTRGMSKDTFYFTEAMLEIINLNHPKIDFNVNKKLKKLIHKIAFYADHCLRNELFDFDSVLAGKLHARYKDILNYEKNLSAYDYRLGSILNELAEVKLYIDSKI